MKTILKYLLAITAVLLIASCGPLKTKWADIKYQAAIAKHEAGTECNPRKNPACNNDLSNPDGLDDVFLIEIAHRFGLMALFAEVVYREDLIVRKQDKAMSLGESYTKGSIDTAKSELDAGCDYLQQTNHPPPEFGMPKLNDNMGGWQRWVGTPEKASIPCYSEHGLFYETYVFKQNNQIKEAVIAFRGTENHRGQFLRDWATNLAAAFGIEPKQYKIARELIPTLIDSLKVASQNPNLKIYTTGHSLGGGLAQQAGYLSADIEEVFTFNTSPITNWTSLALKGQIKNRYPIFHRVYNGGEALGGIRDVSTLFTKARFGRHDIGVQVRPKQLISGHDMTILACHFACLIQESEKQSLAHELKIRHHLSVDFIKNHVMTDDRLCKDYIEVSKGCSVTGSP